MKIKLSDLLEAVESMKRYNTTSNNVYFKFAYVKNLKTLERFVEPYENALKQAIEPTPEYKEFERKRVELISKYSEKDEQGNIKTDSQGNAIIKPDKLNTFTKKMEKFIKENEHLIEERNKQISEYNKLLEKEIDISSLELIQIPLSVIPGDIPVYILSNMMDLDLIKMDVSLEEKIESLHS